MPLLSMNTHASLSRAKRRRGRRSSPAIWLEIFPAARLTFDSFSNSKGARLRRWRSFLEQWDGCFNAECQNEKRGDLPRFGESPQLTLHCPGITPGLNLSSKGRPASERLL